MNRYQMAQLMAYGVGEMQKLETNMLTSVADVKRAAIGQKVGFRISLNDVKAYVQAKHGDSIYFFRGLCYYVNRGDG